jgi:hypothetical protein
MKGSAKVESMVSLGLSFYAWTCGWTLARAHARSGDPIAIAEYLGEDDQFDRSIVDFARRYADQNEQDYQAFAEAIRSGRLQALRRCLKAAIARLRGRRSFLGSISSGLVTDR